MSPTKIEEYCGHFCAVVKKINSLSKKLPHVKVAYLWTPGLVLSPCMLPQVGGGVFWSGVKDETSPRSGSAKYSCSLALREIAKGNPRSLSSSLIKSLAVLTLVGNAKEQTRINPFREKKKYTFAGPFLESKKVIYH